MSLWKYVLVLGVGSIFVWVIYVQLEMLQKRRKVKADLEILRSSCPQVVLDLAALAQSRAGVVRQIVDLLQLTREPDEELLDGRHLVLQDLIGLVRELILHRPYSSSDAARRERFGLPLINTSSTDFQEDLIRSYSLKVGLEAMVKLERWRLSKLISDCQPNIGSILVMALELDHPDAERIRSLYLEFVTLAADEDHVARAIVEEKIRNCISDASADEPHVADAFLDEADVEACRKVLGISSPVSESELKTHYRKLVAAYHPDRLEHVTPEVRSLATHKLAEVNRAYDLLAGRGSPATNAAADSMKTG